MIEADAYRRSGSVMDSSIAKMDQMKGTVPIVPTMISIVDPVCVFERRIFVTVSGIVLMVGMRDSVCD